MEPATNPPHDRHCVPTPRSRPPLRGWNSRAGDRIMPKRGSPPGTFWRGDVLWGRIQVKGQDVRWSLRTSDPKLARERLKADRERLIAQAHYGATTRRLFDEVLAEWARHIPDQVGARTARRYAARCTHHPSRAGRTTGRLWAHTGVVMGANEAVRVLMAGRIIQPRLYQRGQTFSPGALRTKSRYRLCLGTVWLV